MKRYIVLLLVALVLLLPVSVYAASEEDADKPVYDDDVELVSLFDEHGAVMLLIDNETGEILYANEAAAAFYGYTKQELKSMNISQINTLTPAEIEAEMQAAAKEERNYFVLKNQLANGEMRDVEVFPYNVTYNDRICSFSIVHDITEKVRLEQREKDISTGIYIAGGIVIVLLVCLLIIIIRHHKNLKKSKQEIENINELRKTFLDADDSIVYLKDEQLRYVFVNKKFEEYYSKSSADVIGIDDYQLTDEVFAKMRRNTDQAVIENGEKIVDEITWNGHIYQSIKFPVRMINGTYGVGANIRDITRKRNREIYLKKTLVRNKILVDILQKSFISRQEQLDYVLAEVLKLTESQYGYIYLYDEQKQEFTLNSWSHDVMDLCKVNNKTTTYQLKDTGAWGEVVRQRKPIVINDFQAPNPMKKGLPEGHIELQRYMSIPVMIDEQIVAVVGLADKQTDYDDLDIYELTLMMSGVWNAVERREAQDKLIFERNRYLQTIVSIGDGILVVDRQGNIEMLNAVAQTLTGFAQEQAVGCYYKDVFRLSHEKEGHEIADPIEAVFETDTIQLLENSAMLTSKDGVKYCLEDSAAPIKDENGVTRGVVLVFRDVTDKKEQRRRIEYLSYHDALTGLYNRRFFEEEIKRIDVQRNLPISIIMGDVNGLKLTNDIFGHAFGDVLLEKVSEVFKNTCRADDIIARWGGDEFVMLLPKTNEDEANTLITRIKSEFSTIQVKAIKGSISMGAHTKVVMQESISEALDRAEANMYIAKTVEREKVRGDAIKAIISIFHESHPGEKEHSERVSALSQKMGQLLRLPDIEIYKLKFGGLFHDIGKITMEQIKESDTLTETELNERKKHTTIGYRILNSFEETQEFAEAALYHHEQWNGRGYPKGIRESEIPLLARIISIVNYYDNLIRSENGAKTKEEAIKIIKDNHGKRFDPQMVELFVMMMHADNMSW